MTVKSQHTGTNQTYFITFTCHKWIPLFDITNCYSFIENWFNRLIREGNQIIGYVIMPNHLHLLLYLHEQSRTVDKVIGSGKRFMAYHIVGQLKQMGKENIIQELSQGVEANEIARGKRHNVFKTSFDAKPVYTNKFAEQKLDYIHHNPLRGKWSLAKTLEEYPYSSARFYFTGEQRSVKITHYRDAGIFETKKNGTTL